MYVYLTGWLLFCLSLSLWYTPAAPVIISSLSMRVFFSFFYFLPLFLFLPRSPNSFLAFPLFLFNIPLSLRPLVCSHIFHTCTDVWLCFVLMSLSTFTVYWYCLLMVRGETVVSIERDYWSRHHLTLLGCLQINIRYSTSQHPSIYPHPTYTTHSLPPTAQNLRTWDVFHLIAKLEILQGRTKVKFCQ